jgi:hypothetical protein
MEYQLYSASKEAPVVSSEDRAAGPSGRGTGTAAPHVRLPNDPKLDPTRTPLSLEAWVFPGGPNGVIASHGGGQNGYALTIEDKRPAFSARIRGELSQAASTKALDEGWHHLAGVLTDNKRLLLYVDGQLAAEAKTQTFLPRNPNQGFQLGASEKSLVSGHGKGEPFTGLLDQFVLYHRALSEAEIAERAALKIDPVKKSATNGAVLAYAFDNGDARDHSGNKLHGVTAGTETGEGKVSGALLFKNKPAAHPTEEKVAAQPKDPTEPDAKDIKALNDPKTKDAKKEIPAVRSTDTFVQSHWSRPAPLFARSMVKAGDTLLYAGPPDTVDEEYAFERLKFKDKSILDDLAEQNDALDDKKGAKLVAMNNKGDGLNEDGVKLESSPVWDGMIVARGRIYMATVNGKVVCFGKPK